MAKSKNDTVELFVKSMHMAYSDIKTFLRNKLRASDMDLTFEMLQVLSFLWSRPGLNQQEIASLLHKDKASVTYLVDNLSKRGLVERARDEKDRRNKIIILTARGLALKKKRRPWIDEMFMVAGKDIKTEDLKYGIQLFEKIRNNMQAGGVYLEK